MRALIIGLAVLGALFFGAGLYVEHTGRSPDEQVGAVVPWAIALAIWGVDGVIVLVWMLWAKP